MGFHLLWGNVTDAGVTGTGAAIGQGDAAAAAGTPVATGAGADAERSDAAAGAGTTVATGAGADLERSDASAGAGTPVATGAGAAIGVGDSATGAGGQLVDGNGAAINADDAAAGAGVPVATGAGTILGQNDSAAGSGVPVATGAGAILGLGDSAAGAGAPVATGSGAAIDGADAGAGTGSGGSAGSALELGDSAAGVCELGPIPESAATGGRAPRHRVRAGDYDFLNPEYWQSTGDPDIPVLVAEAINVAVQRSAEEDDILDFDRLFQQFRIELERVGIIEAEKYRAMLERQRQAAIESAIMAEAIRIGLINQELEKLAQIERDLEDEEQMIMQFFMEL